MNREVLKQFENKSCISCIDNRLVFLFNMK